MKFKFFIKPDYRQELIEAYHVAIEALNNQESDSDIDISKNVRLYLADRLQEDLQKVLDKLDRLELIKSKDKT